MKTWTSLVAIVLAGTAQAGPADVPSVVAEEWLLVTKAPETPEGLVFDRTETYTWSWWETAAS